MNDRIEAVIGVDVGGTNTDAVILQTNCDKPTVLAFSKALTTADITSGVISAISQAIEKRERGKTIAVRAVNIGTTHFVNAVVQRKDLTKVSVIRLCGSASRGVPPFADFPEDLARCIDSGSYFVNGGYNVDGSEISSVNEDEILEVVGVSIKKGIFNFVVCGIFSPLRNEQEVFVKSVIKKAYPKASVSLSHEIGQAGLIERENASILNESLKHLCQNTVAGFKAVMSNMNLRCPLFLTKNDGTVVGEDYALEHPVCTFASGPTNSMRGAAFLSGVKDAVVVDIGGTTTDVGILRKGFPREASTEVKIGGTRTNFRIPDIYSIGLGGGSYVKQQLHDNDLNVQIGPRSAGHNIVKEAFIFQEKPESCKQELLTATDLAVAAGHTELGNKNNVADLSSDLVQIGNDKIKSMVETAIDFVKLSSEPLPVILVGGGGILLDPAKGLDGASELIFPDFYQVANAVGAALSQISGAVEQVVNLSKNINSADIDHRVLTETATSQNESEEDVRKKIRKNLIDKAVLEAKDMAVKKATDLAIEGGADLTSISVFELSYTQLNYLPGDTIRIQCEVIGDMKLSVSTAAIIDDSYAFKDSRLEEPNSFEYSQLEEPNSFEYSQLEEPTTYNDHYNRTEPYINENNEWILSLYDIECIAIGAGILGCGGGGSPHLGKLLAKRAIKDGKEIKVVNPIMFFARENRTDDVIIQPAFMGAPWVSIEKLVSNEISSAMQCMIDLFSVGQYQNGELRNREGIHVEEENGVSFINDYQIELQENIGNQWKVSAVMSAEIGGLNAIEPLLVGASSGLPVLDCDGMGRAFPELQMFGPLIYDAKPYPAVLADDKGRRTVALFTESAKHLENFFRKVVVEMGCSGAVMLPVLSRDDVLKKTVLFSISRAWNLGAAVMTSRKDKVDPVEAVVIREGGRRLISGKIVDVIRETTEGFNIGYVHVTGLDQFTDQYIVVTFQNENLLAQRIDSVTGEKREILCCTPDLISIVDNDTAEPVTTDMIRYGLRVSVLALPIPDIMKTPEALQVVGPQAFRYLDKVQYISIGDCKDMTSIVS